MTKTLAVDLTLKELFWINAALDNYAHEVKEKNPVLAELLYSIIDSLKESGKSIDWADDDYYQIYNWKQKTEELNK